MRWLGAELSRITQLSPFHPMISRRNGPLDTQSDQRGLPTMLTGYLGRTVKVLACAAAVVLVAAAQSPVDHDVQEVAEYANGGCTMRDGPGDFAQNCFSVYYSGPRVHRLWGYIQAVKYPILPSTVCDATFEIWGQLENGIPYRYSQLVHGCSALTSGVSVEGLDLVFKPGSTICGRSLWQNSWSNPACLDAPDSSSWSGRPWNPHGK